MKKLFAVVLVLGLLLGLTACGGPRTPEEVLSAVSKNMNELQSTGCDLSIDLAMDAGGMDMHMAIEASGEMILDPQLLHMELRMDLGIARMDMQVYSEIADGMQNLYMGMDPGTGMMWVRQSEPAAEQLPSLPAAGVLPLLRELAEDPEPAHSDGMELTCYRACIVGSDIARMLDTIALLPDELMRDTVNPDDLRDMITDDTRLPVTILVDRETMTMREIRLDLTDLADGMTPAIAEDLGVAISEYTITARFHDLNSISSIEIPAEARTAPAL